MGDNDYYAVSVYNIKWETPLFRVYLSTQITNLFILPITYGNALPTKILVKKY